MEIPSIQELARHPAVVQLLGLTGLMVVCAVAFGLTRRYLVAGIERLTLRSRTSWDDVLHDLGMRLCDLAHQDFVIPCLRIDDVQRAHDEGKVAWVATTRPMVDAMAQADAGMPGRIDRAIGHPSRRKQASATNRRANSIPNSISGH